MAKKTKTTKKEVARKNLLLRFIAANRTEFIIGIVGFALSIALHEGLHIMLHLHQITGIEFFPNFYTIAQLVIDLPAQYDLASEEFIAYAISAGTLICTAILIAQIHDNHDRRSTKELLFPELYKKSKTPKNR